MNKRLLFAHLAVIALLLSGCSQNKIPKWLSGEWIFDVEATMENLGESASSEAVDMSNGLSSLLIPMLKGMGMVFSEDGLIISFQGKRTLNEFEVFESEAEKITIKQSDGVLRDFHKSESGFWTLSDDGKMKIFFERNDFQPDKDHSG